MSPMVHRRFTSQFTIPHRSDFKKASEFPQCDLKHILTIFKKNINKFLTSLIENQRNHGMNLKLLRMNVKKIPAKTEKRE